MGGASERGGTTGTGSDGCASAFPASLLPGWTYSWITKKSGRDHLDRKDGSLLLLVRWTDLQLLLLLLLGKKGGGATRVDPYLELTDPPTPLHPHTYTHTRARAHTHTRRRLLEGFKDTFFFRFFPNFFFFVLHSIARLNGETELRLPLTVLLSFFFCVSSRSLCKVVGGLRATFDL